MQAVILAGGKGSRMKKLTHDTPKTLLRFGEKTLLEYTLHKLPKIVDEVIIVIGFAGPKIRDHIGDSFEGKQIQYIVQEEQRGTGHALFRTQSLLKDRFLVLMADDVYSSEAIKEASTHSAAIVTYPSIWIPGKADIVSDNSGNLSDIVFYKEDPKRMIRINTGLYVLPIEIFQYEPVQFSENGEYSLPHLILTASQSVPIVVLETNSWLQVNTPEDLERAQRQYDTGDFFA